MAERNSTPCQCPSCGAETEFLLNTSGSMGRKLDKVVVGKDPVNGNKILFSDIRRKPFRLPWAPQTTLMIGVAPIGIALLLKVSIEMLTSLLPMTGGNAPFEKVSIQLTGMLPVMLGIFLALSVVFAAAQFFANASYIERQAWLDRLANIIDGLRTRASTYTVCSYCNSITKPGGKRFEATDQGLQDALVAGEG